MNKKYQVIDIIGKELNELFYWLKHTFLILSRIKYFNIRKQNSHLMDEGSSPTPGAIFAGLYIIFLFIVRKSYLKDVTTCQHKIQINKSFPLIQEINKFKYNIRNNREETTPFTSTATDTITNRIDIESLKRKIDSITKYQKPYILKLFREVLVKNLENAKIICDYIIAEQNEFNIKESTKNIDKNRKF